MSDSQPTLTNPTITKNLEELLGPRDQYTHEASLSSLQILRLRAWLASKGVAAPVVAGASHYVLKNAYRVGDPYVRKLLETEAEASHPKPKPWRNAPRSGALDLERLEKRAFDDTITTLLDQTLLSGETKPTDPEPSPQPQPSLPPPAASTPVSKEVLESIAHSADQVLTRHLDSAKRSLEHTIQVTIAGMQASALTAVDRRWTEALVTFEQKTKDLVESNRKEIRDLAEKAIPREIRVVSDHKPIQLLPAEARHRAFDEIVSWLLAEENVYVVGPAGTGKTHLFKQVAKAINKPLFLPGQALTKYDVSGYRGPNGDYFGTVVRDALERGGLLCIDEGDMWAATALAFLNAPLANGWCAFPDKTISVHPDFQCVIAANTYGHGATQEYIGRNPLDAASLDRFATVYVDYDEDLERLLFGNGVWVQYIHRIRAAVRELRLQHVVSMRAITRVQRGLRTALSPDQILASSVWRGLEPDTIERITKLAGAPPSEIRPSQPTPAATPVVSDSDYSPALLDEDVRELTRAAFGD